MSKNNISEKYLVVEQKGWRVLALGLVIASLFSLTFKALFSSRRIQYEIERALSASDPRIKASINGAYLSLSDGLFPRLAIVIEKLQIQTSDPCLFGAKATIENLVLPVAFSTLLDRTLVFKRVEVGILNLEMNSRRTGCGTIELNPANTVKENEDELPLESINKVEAEKNANKLKDPTLKETQNKNPLKLDTFERPPLVQTMSVESSFLSNIVFHEVNLKIVEWPLFQWKLQKVEVQLPLKGEVKTHIEGVVTLTSDEKKYPFQGIHAQLEIDSDAEKAIAKIHGAWREGRVEVEGEWSPNQKDFHWKGTFKQIPWSQLLVLAQSLGEAGPLPASSQAWVSAQVDWTHKIDLPEKVEVDGGHIEGEFGDFILGKLIAQRDDTSPHWNVDSYKVLAKEVDLDILTKMLGWQDPPAAFDRLGVFDGQAQFNENQLVSVSGNWKDLQLIFSNRGRREVQVVNNLKLELSGGSNRWAGVLQNIELEDGHWNGNIGISLDQNEKKVIIESSFNDLKLSPQVEELMTMKGELSPIEGRLNLKFVVGLPAEINGMLKLDQAVVNEVKLERLRIDFEGLAENVNGKFQMQLLDFPKSQLQYWPQSLPLNKDNLQFKNLSGRFIRSTNTLELKEVQSLLLDTKSRIFLDAGWSAEGFLHGNLQIRTDRKPQIYQLSGSRTSPIWLEKNK